ncbi:MAG TPA: lipid-A-disaccharide synthase [Myxococcota bacterium]|nr:lipid-A-disaccharide synthase [Myxococcota bacterium]
MATILLAAGDASGELHAAALVEELRRRLPGARFLGLGGDAMEKAGVELVVHQRELAIGGLVEVLRDVGRVVGAWRRLGRALREQRPDLVVLVDSPDFCIPFARRARRAGVPVLYYVSPQVWAWRRYRIGKIARRVDRMAVIFPFEPAVYAGTGLRVEFVGHPLVDRLPEREAGPDARAAARARLGIEPAAPVVALLPGSRRNELRDSLPLQLETARLLARRDPALRVLLALAPSLARADLDRLLADAPAAAGVPLQVVERATYDAVRAADVVLVKPGTATVEIALLGTPMVVAARAHPVTAAIARRVLRVPSLAMVNLIAGAAVVPEFVQEAARPERIAAAVRELLDGPAGELQRRRLRELRARLGGGGAAGRAAEIAEEMLRGAARA